MTFSQNFLKYNSSFLGIIICSLFLMTFSNTSTYASSQEAAICDVKPLQTSDAIASWKTLPTRHHKKDYQVEQSLYRPFSALHRTLPQGTLLKVTDYDHHHSILVVIIGNQIEAAETTLVIDAKAQKFLSTPKKHSFPVELEVLDRIEVLDSPNLALEIPTPSPATS